MYYFLVPRIEFSVFLHNPFFLFGKHDCTILLTEKLGQRDAERIAYRRQRRNRRHSAAFEHMLQRRVVELSLFGQAIVGPTALISQMPDSFKNIHKFSLSSLLCYTFVADINNICTSFWYTFVRHKSAFFGQPNQSKKASRYVITYAEKSQICAYVTKICRQSTLHSDMLKMPQTMTYAA